MYFNPLNPLKVAIVAVLCLSPGSAFAKAAPAPESFGWPQLIVGMSPADAKAVVGRQGYPLVYSDADGTAGYGYVSGEGGDQGILYVGSSTLSGGRKATYAGFIYDGASQDDAMKVYRDWSAFADQFGRPIHVQETPGRAEKDVCASKHVLVSVVNTDSKATVAIFAAAEGIAGCEAAPDRSATVPLLKTKLPAVPPRAKPEPAPVASTPVEPAPKAATPEAKPVALWKPDRYALQRKQDNGDMRKAVIFPFAPERYLDLPDADPNAPAARANDSIDYPMKRADGTEVKCAKVRTVNSGFYRTQPIKTGDMVCGIDGNYFETAEDFHDYIYMRTPGQTVTLSGYSKKSGQYAPFEYKVVLRRVR